MRLKEDSSSWRSRGIQRRDYRHDFGTPEVPKGHPKRKVKKPRKRIDHKHIWIEEGPWWPEWWPYRLTKEEAERPTMSFRFKCSVVGCQATKRKTNPRYGYEMHKYRKKGRD